jgi:myosin light chain 6
MSITHQTTQVGEVIRALGQNPTEAEVKRLAVQNHAQDSRVAFDTFLPILQAVSQKQIADTADDFVEGLRHFDKVERRLEMCDGRDDGWGFRCRMAPV